MTLRYSSIGASQHCAIYNEWHHHHFSSFLVSVVLGMQTLFNDKCENKKVCVLPNQFNFKPLVSELPIQ